MNEESTIDQTGYEEYLSDTASEEALKIIRRSPEFAELLSKELVRIIQEIKDYEN